MEEQKEIRYKIIHTPKEITERVDTLARQILEYANPNDIFICLLNGGVFFYCDLLKALSLHNFNGVKLTFLKTSTIEKNGTKYVEVSDYITETSIVDALKNGANIWIIDEIMDSGRSVTKTIDWVESNMKLYNIVKCNGKKPLFNTVMMLEREGATVDRRVHTRLVGFKENRKEWFVGYGMDGSNGTMRAFPCIAIELPDEDVNDPE